MNAEEKRLKDARERKAHWKRWGPYLSERAWGTVREDYSPDGSAWEYLTHDDARSRAYRWNEDGLAGFSDRHGRICLAVALWNGRDPFLKERLFGLTGPEGNHGEDVKECYWYLDGTPTHSYARLLYKYPQSAFPYERLRAENRRRGREDREFELLDTGVFAGDRYFDVFVEYAKESPEDVLLSIRAVNRGPEPAPLHVLPTIWFRNTWSWGDEGPRPRLRALPPARGTRPGSPSPVTIELEDPVYGRRWLRCDGAPELLFTENETNVRRLYGVAGPPYAKDAFHEYVVEGRAEAVNPERTGTKAAAHYALHLEPGQRATLRLRFTPAGLPSAGADLLGAEFSRIFARRIREADAFYATIVPPDLPDEGKAVMRQALAGMLWSKQFYHYVVERWLDGDPGQPPPPAARRRGRNRGWRHLHNADVLSVPDKWEYPWYAGWDLAFHCIPLALVDSDFAKEQLLLLLREWYQHPSGQLPAYEWSFDDVNPPVHAWAAWRVYKIERKRRGKGDLEFLERVFHKLLLNFTWWVNRRDADGMNVFQGGFLGLDNIGPFDRGAAPGGGHLEQADATSWMGMYSLDMLAIAAELARTNPAYEDVASKFFEHFLHIGRAMNDLGEDGVPLWDDGEGFFHDLLHRPGDGCIPLRLRSMVGLIPLFAVETLEPDLLERLPGFRRRLEWVVENRPELVRHVACGRTPGRGDRRLLSLVTPERLRRILARMLDEREFLSPYGIRSLSRAHANDPLALRLDGVEHRVGYEPGESESGLFGGNSNWRGPVWFPVNYLVIESLQRFHHYLGEGWRVELPTGSGRLMSLREVAAELSRRLASLFLRDAEGRRPAHGDSAVLQGDPLWDFPLFHEYFHAETGRGLGASHQTGWTGLVAKLLQQSGMPRRQRGGAPAAAARGGEPEITRRTAPTAGRAAAPRAAVSGSAAGRGAGSPVVRVSEADRRTGARGGRRRSDVERPSTEHAGTPAEDHVPDRGTKHPAPEGDQGGTREASDGTPAEDEPAKA
ncbi:MAG TPA: glucosidase [Gemmatimonadota bacterium]